MKKMNKFALLFLMASSLSLTSACGTVTYRMTPIVTVVRDYAPSVVNIRTESIVNLKEMPEWGLHGDALDEFFRNQFGDEYSEGTLKYKSIGSGVILDNSGLIVTNAHVVQKASTIYVVLKDETLLHSEVLDINRSDDLAIIKVDLPHPVKNIKVADIKDLMIGETVIAIGNPYGLENSVTVGVVSGKDRSFPSPQCEYVCSGLIQTDASINPGNSGGALLNLDGELLGVNLAVAQNAQNIGFAVPANKIKTMIEKYKQK